MKLIQLDYVQNIQTELTSLNILVM